MAKKKSKKMGVLERRRNQILKLSQRALKLNSETEAKIQRYESEGYNIENRDYILRTQQRILNILAKARPTEDDVQMMREFASQTFYDYVKIGGKKYQTVRKSGKRLAQEVNQALKTAVEIYPVRNEVYTNYLEPLMETLTGDPDYEPQAGDENEYFKVSKNYTGKPEEEFKFIEFKDIPTDIEDAVDYAEDIQSLDWSSYENYDKRLQRISHSKYLSNLKRTDADIRSIETAIEQIMNSSAAWHIASKNADDSEQVKANWLQLLTSVENAQLHGDKDLLDQVLTMIEQETDLDIILNVVEVGLTEMIRS